MATNKKYEKEEWVPPSHRVGDAGTVSHKVTSRASVFDSIAQSEQRKQEKQTPANALEKAIKAAAAIRKSHPGNLAAKHFEEDYVRSLKKSDQQELLKIVKSGLNNPDSSMGCYAMNPNDYDKFNPFFSKVLYEYHRVKPGTKHVNNWDLKSLPGLPRSGLLDVSDLGLPPLSMRVRTGRNLKDFPLPGAMTKKDRIAMEIKMCEAFKVLIANKDYGGSYYSLTPDHENFIDSTKYNELVKAHIMFKDMSADSYLVEAGIAADWPFGRGCYVSEDKGFIIWVGEEDHLRIMCMKKTTVLNEVFERLKKAIDVINAIEGLSFAIDANYGVVTSCPTNIGTGMRASVLMQIPNLTRGGSDKKAKEICKPLGLSVRGLGGEHTPIGDDGTCDISPSARFCISEAEILMALYTGVKNLKEADAKH